jgi:hypothetical protein
MYTLPPILLEREGNVLIADALLLFGRTGHIRQGRLHMLRLCKIVLHLAR